MPLVDHGGGFTVVSIQYGDLVGQKLERLGYELPPLVAKAALGRNHTVEMWYEIISLVYRLGFEPLARDAGFRRSYIEEPVHRPGDNPEDSPFYRAHVAEYWQRALTALERSLSSEFDDIE